MFIFGGFSRALGVECRAKGNLNTLRLFLIGVDFVTPNDSGFTCRAPGGGMHTRAAHVHEAMGNFRLDNAVLKLVPHCHMVVMVFTFERSR